MVRVFQSLASERRLQSFTGGLTVKSAQDYTPQMGDVDYVRGSDVPWVKRFAADGGRVIISGDTAMMKEDHERQALLETSMVVMFFGPEWSKWKFHRKCALLLNWWPAMVTTSRLAEPRTFWRIPTTWENDGNLVSIPTANKYHTRIETQKAAQVKIAKERAARRQKTSVAEQGDFFGNDGASPARPKKKP